jgi:hypothetical protein
MQRIEWVKQRLENWALWKDREDSGRRGWDTASVLLNTEPSGGYRECKVPILDVDASVTNEGVESLRGPRFHLYETLLCIYPQGLGIKETARRTQRAESTIKAHLAQADHALAAWFAARNGE